MNLEGLKIDERHSMSSSKSQSWPHFGEDEIAAVAEVLRSGKVNQWGGTKVNLFQQEMVELCGANRGVAVHNGSLALELALRALQIGQGDEVIVTSRSFIASASCVSLVGATPVFADIDENSQNITAQTIEPLLSDKTKAIIPVHLVGWPCDMPEIMALAEKHDLKVIEDCAQAIGAKIDGRPAGSFGHAAILSFCTDKIISTGGEGGMALFRDADVWERAWSYKDHGKDWIKSRTPTSNPWFRYVHDSIGTNWRMTEMQAAIGLVQLTKLENWLIARRENAAIWYDALKECPALRIPVPPANIEHSFYKFHVFLVPGNLKDGADQQAILTELRKAEVRAFSGTCPEIYREAAYEDMKVETRPMAHALGKTSLMFEVHPTLDQDELRENAALARQVIANFERV